MLPCSRHLCGTRPKNRVGDIFARYEFPAHTCNGMHRKGVEGVTKCAAALVRFLRYCPSSDYATLSQFNGTAAIEQQCADAMAVFTTLIPVLRIVAADNLPSGVLQGVGVS